MRRVLLIAMVGCGADASPAETAPVQRPVQPSRAVMVRIERRPPVGAHWHERDTVAESEARGAERHERLQVLDAEVAVVETTAEREVDRVVIRQHTIRNDGAAGRGKDRALAPGTELRVTRSRADCEVTVDGEQVGDDDHVHVTNLLDCRWPAVGQRDDDVLGLTVPRRVGETWPMDRERLRQREIGDATYNDDEVTLERIGHDGGVEAAVLRARFHERHEVGGVAIERRVTHTYRAPLDPSVPVLAEDEVIQQTRGEIEATYHLTRERTPR